MHIIAILGVIATVVFYFSRIARGASDIADASQGLRNLPRKRRFQKHARATGFDLIDSPIEAATMLMLACAAQGRSQTLTPAERDAVMDALRDRLGQTTLEADDLITQVGAMLHDVLQPGGAVLPMTRILAPVLSRRDASDLAAALRDVAGAEGATTDDQRRFIDAYRDRMGLG